MTAQFHALGLILLFPLLGFLFNLFWGDRMGRGAVNVVGPGVIFAAFVVAVTGFVKLHGYARRAACSQSRCGHGFMPAASVPISPFKWMRCRR